MRRYLAVLALAPAVAWGDCYDLRLQESFTDMALAFEDSLADGVSERQLLELARQIDDDGAKAAAYEAITQLVVSRPVPTSIVVSAMQNACRRATRR